MRQSSNDRFQFHFQAVMISMATPLNLSLKKSSLFAVPTINWWQVYLEMMSPVVWSICKKYSTISWKQRFNKVYKHFFCDYPVCDIRPSTFLVSNYDKAVGKWSFIFQTWYLVSHQVVVNYICPKLHRKISAETVLALSRLYPKY